MGVGYSDFRHPKLQRTHYSTRWSHEVEDRSASGSPEEVGWRRSREESDQEAKIEKQRQKQEAKVAKQRQKLDIEKEKVKSEIEERLNDLTKF